ncbi:MAG: PEP-CTERM sorting domain-containing protein [Proteobacteria bacterium]|nr:PEP-CTERM sorting domain-containing protein [Pseudomonadota bacterium]
MSKKFLSVVMLGLLLPGAASAKLITSGTLSTTTTSVFSPWQFFLLGEDFAVSGGINGAGDNGLTGQQCEICRAGYVANASGGAVGLSFRGGNAILPTGQYNGISWGNLFAGGPSIFRFSTPDFVISGPGVFSTNFEFEGSLCGTVAPYSCAVNLPDLRGSGTVSVGIYAYDDGNGGQLLSFNNITYTFVPEPGVLSLFLFGFIGLLVASRKRVRFGVTTRSAQ